MNEWFWSSLNLISMIFILYVNSINLICQIVRYWTPMNVLGYIIGDLLKYIFKITHQKPWRDHGLFRQILVKRVRVESWPLVHFHRIFIGRHLLHVVWLALCGSGCQLQRWERLADVHFWWCASNFGLQVIKWNRLRNLNGDRIIWASGCLRPFL